LSNWTLNGILLLTVFLQVPFCAGAQNPQKEVQLFKVGVTGRSIVPNEPYDWRGAQTHALITQIWYPAEPTATEQPQWIGPTEAPLLSAGKAAPEAKLASSPGKFPLIVLSHGTGGSALVMAWLATALASHGYTVAAVLQ